MLQALINSWFSMANDPIPQAEHKFQEDVHRALAISAWGGGGQLLAMSWLFNRPIFAYNSFYEGSQLSLGDTTNVIHLSQRFLNFERGTRIHMLFCSTPQDSVLRHGDTTALPKLPLILFHIVDYHWVACLYHSPTVITQIPIPRFRLLREL